jgi:hypothetical protein
LVLLAVFTLFSKIRVEEFWIEGSLLSVMIFCGVIGGFTGYSIDLIASAISSILVSAILIPILGIPLSLWGLALINLTCLGYLLFLSRHPQIGI